MSTKHTPGRMSWHTRDDGSKYYKIGDFRDEFAGHAQGDIEINEDDMQRVAACWNACEGITTENLEDNIPVRELASRHTDLLRTMGALLAACTRWEMPGLAEIIQATEAFKAAGGEL